MTLRAFLRAHRVPQAAIAAAYGPEGCTVGFISNIVNGRRAVPDWGKLLSALSSCVEGTVVLETVIHAEGGEVIRQETGLRLVPGNQPNGSAAE